MLLRKVLRDTSRAVGPWASSLSMQTATLATLPKTTKAIVIDNVGDHEVMELREVPLPPALPSGSVLVANEVVGVNSLDTYHRSGLLRMPLPGVLGVEGAGVVAAVGSGVEGLQVGDRVGYILQSRGAYAQHTVVPFRTVAKLPDGVSFEHGCAAMIQGMTAWAFVTLASEGAPREGDWVAVHGAERAVSQLLVQVAALHGAKVVATVRTEKAAQAVRDRGAEHVVLFNGRFNDMREEVVRITGGMGAAVLYDSMGNDLGKRYAKDNFDYCVGCLRHLGWLLTLGHVTALEEPVNALALAHRNVRLMRPQLFGFLAERTGAFQELAGQVLRAVDQGKLRVRVHKVYPLEAAAAAHIELRVHMTSIGKLLLKPGP